MANEIVHINLGVGKDGYFQVLLADLTIYNGTAFETHNAPDWATQYARGKAATDARGDYKANFPTLAAGYYFYKVFACNTGDTAASTDDLAQWGGFYWDGTQRTDQIAPAAAGGGATAEEIAEAIWAEVGAELTEVPGASASMKDRLIWASMALIGKRTQTDSLNTLFNASNQPVATAATSDLNGTTTVNRWQVPE